MFQGTVEFLDGRFYLKSSQGYYMPIEQKAGEEVNLQELMDGNQYWALLKGAPSATFTGSFVYASELKPASV